MEREFTQEEADRHNALTEHGWALIEGQLFVHDSTVQGPPNWLARRKLSQAIRYFERALEINPAQADVARETGLTALDCGDVTSALQFCSAAVENRSDDPGLVCNLALAHMLAGDDSAAVQCAADALDRAPNDGICGTVLQFVQDVANGKRERPKTIEQAFPN